MITIREKLKKNKLIFKIWHKLYNLKLDKMNERKTKGKYNFFDKSKKQEDLCIILAGYKEFLWKDVFERIEKFTPKNIDVCVVSPGLFNEKLKQMCIQNDWSYLSVEENKVTLAQNIAISLHPNAKYIYKLDEDMFITEGFFENLKNTYVKVKNEGKYKPGLVAPLININGYSYRIVLEKTNLLDKFKEKFGNCYIDATPGEIVLTDKDVAKFLWGEHNEQLKNIDKLSEEFSRSEFKYSPCPVRFSIGAVLIPRTTWENMGKFDVLRGTDLGEDENQICKYCLLESRPVIVSENILVGHFSYGPQTTEMKKYYQENKNTFSLKD